MGGDFLSLSVDWYKIKVNNVIVALGAQAIANNCYDQPSLANVFCSLFERNLTGAPDAFEREVERYAHRLADAADYPLLLAGKRERRAIDEQRKPLRAYRREELVEMSADIMEDRRGFASARHAFVTGRRLPVAVEATA